MVETNLFIRRAKPEDIMVGAEFIMEGDHESGKRDGSALWIKRVVEVEDPSDPWKAFSAQDGCRYGLEGLWKVSANYSDFGYGIKLDLSSGKAEVIQPGDHRPSLFITIEGAFREVCRIGDPKPIEEEKIPKGFDKDRARIMKLTDAELLDELSRPVSLPESEWQLCVSREALRRILWRLKR